MLIEWHRKLSEFVTRSQNGNEMVQRVAQQKVKEMEQIQIKIGHQISNLITQYPDIFGRVFLYGD